MQVPALDVRVAKGVSQLPSVIMAPRTQDDVDLDLTDRGLAAEMSLPRHHGLY
jgi:hypothetical protein